MDARVKPAHDTGFVVRRIVSPENIFSANASLSRGFDFGPRGGPLVPVFLLPSKREEWSAGRRPGACEAPLGRPCDRPACASYEDARARAKGPAPPDAPSAVRHPTSRSTTPSIEQGMASVPDLGNGTRVMRITMFVRWGWSSKTDWMPRPIGERSDAVLRTAIGERSDAVLRTAIGERSDAFLRTAMRGA